MGHIVGMPASRVFTSETTPSDISNIWEWWEASRETTYSDNDAFTTLHGQFASKDWNETDAAHKCVYRTNQINGLAVSLHNLSGGFERGWNGAGVPDMSALTAGHVFIIVKIDTEPPGTAQATGLWSMANNTGDTFRSTHYPFTDGTIYDACGSSARKTVGNPTPALTSWRVYEVVSISGEWTAKIDGTQIFTTATNTVAFPSNPALGINFDESAGLVGQIAGLYIFSAKLSSGDRTTLINYINDRFGLSSS